jgi:hypothetical protein
MRWVAYLLCASALSCAAPPVHALIVRHPEQKCALIAFSGCRTLLAESRAKDADDDAGAE